MCVKPCAFGEIVWFALKCRMIIGLQLWNSLDIFQSEDGC